MIIKVRKQIEPSDMIYELGSKIWPSNDPEDSPFDKYVCKHCGRTESFQSCGTFMLGIESHEGARHVAKMNIIRHFEACRKWPMVEIEI